MNEDTTVRFASLGREHLTLSVRFSDDPEPYNQFMLVVHVKAELSNFSADVENAILTKEFMKFYQDLLSLYESLEGAASFTTFEDWLGIDVTAKKHGYISISGYVAQHSLGSPKDALHFRLADMDQTYLGLILEDFKKAIAFLDIQS